MTRRKRHEGGEPAGAARDAEAARRPVRTARPRALIIVLFAAALVAAAVRFFPRRWSEPGPPEAQRQAAQSDPLRAEAFSLADQVVREYPGDPDALHARGLILNRFSRSAEALACWQACLEIDPAFASAWYCLGRHAFDQGQYDECIARMKQALAAEPGLWDALLYLGRAEMHLGRMEEAVADLREHVAQSPKSTEGHYELGHALQHLKRYEDAADSYRAAIAADPKCKYAWYGLSEVCRRLGQEEKAAECRKKFEELRRERTDDGRRHRRDRSDKADMLESVAHAHDLVGKVCAARGDREQAEKHARRATELRRNASATKSDP